MKNLIILLLVFSPMCVVCIAKENAQELISHYLENHKYCFSQITKSETLVEYYNDKADAKPQLNFYKTEFRRDHDRWEKLETMLRGLKSRDSFEAEYKQSMRRIWDGNKIYGHWFFKDSPENVLEEQPIIITNNPTPINRTFAVGYYGAPFDGIFVGDLDPISVIMERSSEVSVREKKENIGNSECSVIDVSGNDGRYTIWIDIKHGYNIIQAEAQKKGNNNAYGTRLENDDLKMTGRKFSMKNVRLEKIDGYWVPVEGDFFIEVANGQNIFTEKRHHKRINVELHPDFEKVGAFVPNIPNGTPILIMEASGIQYVWQNGKPVSSVDQGYLKDIDASIDNTHTEINSKSSISDVVKKAGDPCSGSENRTNDSKLNSAAGNIKKTGESPVTKRFPIIFSPAIWAVCSLLVIAFFGFLIYSKYKRE